MWEGGDTNTGRSGRKLLTNPVESHGGLNQGSGSCGDKKQSDFIYILKVENIGYPEGLDVKYDKKRNPG